MYIVLVMKMSMYCSLGLSGRPRKKGEVERHPGAALRKATTTRGVDVSIDVVTMTTNLSTTGSSNLRRQEFAITSFKIMGIVL